MKSAIDSTSGRIVGYDERRKELLIRAPYDDVKSLIKREYKSCIIQLIDSRPLSDKQRKSCYAMIGAISEFTGMGKEPSKEWLKLKFIVEDLQCTSDRIFSLSNAPMSLVCAFQRFLVRFILDWDIPLSFSLLDMVDDIQDYIYSCLISKKCVICGKHAELHHIDRVGMGRDRKDILHEGLEAISLCRKHHEEAHSIPDSEFFGKYHINGGIILDKTLCKIWKLKRDGN